MNTTISSAYPDVDDDAIDPVFKSCFEFKTSACVRSATLAIMALMTALLAAVLITKSHMMRAAKYYLVINYATFVLCIMCMVNWLYPGVQELEFIIAFTMLLEYVSVFCLYWMLGRSTLTSCLNVGVRIVMIFILLMTLLSTAMLVLSLLSRRLPHCSRLQFLSLSLTEFMLACLMLLLAQQIYKRYSGVSMTHAMRTAQKHEFFLIASVFLSCSIFCLTFDSILFATTTYVFSSVPVNSDSNLHFNSNLSTESTTTTLSITTSPSSSDYTTVACKELHSKKQYIYDIVYSFEMVVRYLLPLWFLLLIVKPRQNDFRHSDNPSRRNNENTPLLRGHEVIIHSINVFGNNNVPVYASSHDQTSPSSSVAVQVPRKSPNSPKPRAGTGQMRFGSYGPAPLLRPFPFYGRATSTDNDSNSSEYGSPTETYLATGYSQLTDDPRRINSSRHGDLVDNLLDEHHSMLAATSTTNSN